MCAAPTSIGMATTLWIHRALASDILVRCSSRKHAYDVGRKILFDNYDEGGIINEWDGNILSKNYDASGNPYLPEMNSFDVGCTANLQVSLEQADFIPTGWNDNTVVVSDVDAMALGTANEPEGFIPDEQAIWVKEYRSHAQLDDEIHRYMGDHNSVCDCCHD